MTKKLKLLICLSFTSVPLLFASVYALGGGGGGGGGGGTSLDCGSLYTPTVFQPADSGNIFVTSGSVNLCTVKVNVAFNVKASAFFFEPGLSGYSFSALNAPEAGCGNTFPIPPLVRLKEVQASIGSFLNPADCTIYNESNTLNYRLTLNGSGASYTPVSGRYKSVK